MQQGIQTAHVIGELISEFQNLWDTRKGIELTEWATHYKTLRVLNAGSGDTFEQNKNILFLLASKYDLPVTHFSEPDINNMITAFGVIMPPRVVDEVTTWQYDNAYKMSFDKNLDHEIALFLKSMKSAR